MSEQTTDDGVVTIPEVTVEGDPTNADPNLDANLRTYFTYGPSAPGSTGRRGRTTSANS